MKYFWLVIFHCFILSSVAQSTWYVSTEGSNDNTGLNLDDAFATVTFAIESANCGDSIFVAGGEYIEKILAYSDCPENNRIVVQGDPADRPLITGDPMATNRYAIGASGSGYRFRHLELTSPNPEICDPANMVIVGRGDYFDFIDLIVRHGGYDGIKTTSDCELEDYPIGWRVIDCQVLNNGLGCPASIVNGDGIDFTACRNCVIENSVIKNNMGHQVQIKLGASNVHMVNSYLEGYHMLQIGLPGNVLPCDTSVFNADSIYVRNNVFLAKGDTSEFMIRMADVKNLYIEHNTLVKDTVIKDVGFMCFGGCGSSDNWQYRPQPPTVVRNNIFCSYADLPFYAGPDTAFFDPLNAVPENVEFHHNLFYNLHNDFITPPDNSENSIIGDPLFCNYPMSFALADDSPCIDAGDPDYGYDPDGTPPDLGAIPYTEPCEVGVDESSTVHFNVLYPNPSNGLFNVDASILEGVDRVAVYSVHGNKVHTLQVNNDSGFLDLRHLQAGYYVVQFHFKNGYSSTQRVGVMEE